MVQPTRGAVLATAPCNAMPTTQKATKPQAPKPLATSKGVDKFGFAKTGKRAFAATLYSRKAGATTAQVKAATLAKYKKGYPMLNMLRKLNATSKAWAVQTTSTNNPTTGRAVTVYRIVARK